MIEYTLGWGFFTSSITNLEIYQVRLKVDNQVLWRGDRYEECSVSLVAHSADSYAVIHWVVSNHKGPICAGSTQCATYRLMETAQQGAVALAHYLLSYVLPSYQGHGDEI